MTSPRRSAELRTPDRDGAALVKRIAGGDESAFATLYDTTCGLIYGLLLRILDNAAAAEQVLADVYKEVWEQAATYNDKREEPLTWLITMARHRAIVRLRADSQDQERLTKLAERAVTTNPKTNSNTSEQQRIVRSALTALPSVQQQIIEQAYFYGLRQNEIAARLDLSLQSVRTGMQAGMTRLFETFKSHQLYRLKANG